MKIHSTFSFIELHQNDNLIEPRIGLPNLSKSTIDTKYIILKFH